MVLSRGYRPPEDVYPALAFPVHEPRVPLHRLVLQRWRNRRAVRAFLAGLGPEERLWYLPHTSFPQFPLLLNDPPCRGFSLIEEGLGAYHTQEDSERLLQGRLRPLGRLAQHVTGPLRFADHRYRFAYGCTEDAFPGYARRVQVRIAPPAQAASADIRAVLAFDALLEHGFASKAPFLRCVQALVARAAADGHRIVHFKLHPQQYVEPAFTPALRQLLEGNAHGVQFRELPASFCLEGLAAAGQADFYIFISSVGIYAAAAGCRVTSVARSLRSLDERFRTTCDRLPQVMRHYRMI
jgi:hypothetical protein